MEQTTIKMQLAQIYPEELVLIMRDVQSERMKRDWSVMQRQINLYVEKVKMTKFYPKIGEAFLLKLGEKTICIFPNC